MKVYHGTFEKNIRSILEKGIIPYYMTDKKTAYLRIGIRRGSVYAYLRETLDRISEYSKPDYVWIEIEVDPKKVFIAEMRFEHQEMDKESLYWKSFMRLDEYEKYTKILRKYMEPEVLIPRKVSPEQLTGVILDWKLRPMNIGDKSR